MIVKISDGNGRSFMLRGNDAKGIFNKIKKDVLPSLLRGEGKKVTFHIRPKSEIKTFRSFRSLVEICKQKGVKVKISR
jgi:predicted nucleic acid-binding OB-fold protein